MSPPFNVSPSPFTPWLRFEIMSAETVSASGAPDTEAESTLPPWDEPRSLDDLLKAYVVENKFAGRCAGSTLYLVQAKSTSGQTREVEDPNQQFKLFLAHALAISKLAFAHSPFSS